MPRLRSILAAALLLTSACGRDVPDFGPSSSDLLLFVEPQSLDLYLGQTFTFDVTLSEEEAPKSVLGEADLILALGDSSVVDISADGTGTAKAAGRTTLTATYLGLEAESIIEVHDGELASIDVLPPAIRLQVSQTHQIRVTGLLDNGDQIDLTRGYHGTTYSVANEGVATVTEDGLIRAVAEGATSITVTHGSFSAQVQVQVTQTKNEITRIEIEPAVASLEFSETLQLRVFGIDTDGNRIDLIGALPTYPVTFESSDPAVATVGETALVSALRRPGTVMITARLDDLTATAEIRVRPPEAELIDLIVQPELVQLPEGESVQLRVTGRYQDGSIADLTLGTTGTSYLSSDPRGFSVDANGRVTGQRRGAFGFVAVTHGPFERVVQVEVVGESELIGLEVTPPFLDMQVGQVRQLEVLALYADGSVIDVTNGSSGVQYIPPPDGFVTVSPNGFVQANFRGAGSLVIRYQGFEVFVPITVTDENRVTSIFIAPPFITVPEGQSTNVTVFAELSNGSVIDITFDPGLTITSDRPRVAAYVGFGVVEGRNAGFTTLRASYQGFAAQADVEVTGGMRVLVGISLSMPPQIGLGQTVGYQVIGMFSDGSVQDLTFDAATQVVSTDPSILDVFAGIATGLSPGITLVVADHLGFSDAVMVEVTPNVDPIVAIAFQPATLNLPVGGAGFTNLVAIRQSGAVTDITSDPGVILSTTGPIGTQLVPNALRIDAFGPGLGQVIASYQGFSATLDVNVGQMNPVVGIDIVARSTLLVNDTDTLFVVAFFADGTFSDISFDPGLSISSSNPNVLQLSIPTMTGVSVGQATINATYQGFSDALTVTVTNTVDPVVALEFVPPSLNMQVGQQATANVIATYASGRVEDVTFNPGLNINLTGPVSIAPGPGGNILIDALSQGMASLQASFEGASATLPITIQNTVTLIGIDLRTPMQMAVGAVEPYEVIARFSDMSTQTVTFDPGVSITVGNPMVLAAGGGSLTGISVGQTSVTATYQGFSDTNTVEVINNDPIVALSWTPPQLNLPMVGDSQVAQVFALFASGNILDVTNDPGTTFSITGPISTAMVPGGLEVTGLAPGNAQVTATYQGFTAGLPVTVGSVATLIDIRVEPPVVQLAEGDSVQLTVIGIFSDGTEAPITGASFLNFDPSIADVSPSGLVTGLAAGTGGALVFFGNFSVFVQIDVTSAAGPQITSINPNAIAVGSPPTLLTVNGSNFTPGDAVFVDGLQLTTTFVSGTELSANVPGFVLAFPATLNVQVRGPHGRSNIVPLLVGAIPNVTSYSPSSLFEGSSVDVTAIGSGLDGLNLSASGGLTVMELAAAPDGTWVRLRVTAPPNTPPGMYTLTLSNALGMDTIQMEVLTQNLPDLVVNAGQTVFLSGTNAFGTVTVQTGGRIVGQGLETLAIIASNDITIRGTIDVSGHPGDQGFTEPGDGGDAGPGGAGGGGGSDGNSMIGGAGGDGSPPGGEGAPGSGPGTPAGFGGGEGGGDGGAFGCGHGGGGGALGGDGGSGGGDFGPGSGGFGGVAGGRGSTFGNGTGGGGGSTCGQNGGGGGGGGGGGLILQVAPGGSILVDGAITAKGGNGGDGFGGTGAGAGGSGGRVEINAPGGTITVNDTISVRGGDGGDTDFGDTGGGGGGGIIVIDATGGSANVGLGFLEIDGGQPGTSLGGGFPGEAGTPGQTSVTP